MEPILLYDELVEQDVEGLKVFVVQRGVKNGQSVKVPKESESFGAKVEVISNFCFFKELYQ